MSSSVSGCNVSSSDRESSGEITEKNGFSVVAAISVTRRFSTAGNRASCCVFENRCTSSMNSTVCVPFMPSWRRASSSTSRTSLTPALTADSSTNRRDVAWLTTCASVVLPVPGGPHRNTELPPASGLSTIRRSGVPGPRRCCCPTTSSRVRGRMRTASGATARCARAVASSNSVTSPTLWLDASLHHGVDAGFFEILRRDGSGCAGERVATRRRLRERYHLADRLGARKHREHAVPPERDAAVRRRPEGEGLEQEAELRLRFFRRQADHVEYPLLHLAAVDTDRAAADLAAVQHDVVGVGDGGTGVGVERISELGLRRSEGVVDGGPAAAVGRLEHRRVDHPQKLPLRRVNQLAASSDLESGRPEQFERWGALTGGEEDRIAR